MSGKKRRSHLSKMVETIVLLNKFKSIPGTPSSALTHDVPLKLSGDQGQPSSLSVERAEKGL